MSKTDNVRPVSSIKHDDKRAAIPDSAHQGEEQVAISGQPEESEYDIFRHQLKRGCDPQLYWLGKYKNDDEDNLDYMSQLRTDIRSLYKHEDIRPEAIIDNLYELHEHKSESAKMQLTSLATCRIQRMMSWSVWPAITNIAIIGRIDSFKATACS